MSAEFVDVDIMHGPEIDPLDRLVILHDENQTLKETNQRLHELATTDELTGLHNRHGLREWAEKHYDPTRSYAMLVLDFADFGTLNNTYGQEVGDEALRIFGGVFPRVLRTDEQSHDERRAQNTSDAAAIRIGGDEFVAIIDLDHIPEEEFENILLKITARLTTSYVLAGRNRLPEVPRIRMDSVNSIIGEVFNDFFVRGNSQINVFKANQKMAEARTKLDRMFVEQDGFSFS